MVEYLLDTNVCIGLLKRHSTILSHIQTVGWEQLSLCAPVKAELWYGAYKSDRPQANLAVLRDMFIAMPSLPFDDHAAKHYGEIRAILSRSGTPIGSNDLLIAAIGESWDTIRISRRNPNLGRL